MDTPVEVAMRTSWTWAWASVLALCLTPGVAQARERGRDRGHGGGGGGGERRSEGRSDRAERRSDRGRERANRDSGRERPRWEAPSARASGGRSGRDESRRFTWGGGSSGRVNRDSDRGGRARETWGNSGRSSREAWGNSGRERRDDRQWRGSYRAPRRGFPSYRYRPGYRADYRYGYFHRHGYAYPRYYYDYDSYPTHASIRVLVEPREAEVYVDGYYAGVADDFDGIFQRLYLAPGRHEITLRLDGYRTWSAEVFATPGCTLKLHHDMFAGPSGPEFGDEPGQDEEPGVYEAPDAYDRPDPGRE